jgi:hypothetical protein
MTSFCVQRASYALKLDRLLSLSTTKLQTETELANRIHQTVIKSIYERKTTRIEQLFTRKVENVVDEFYCEARGVSNKLR